VYCVCAYTYTYGASEQTGNKIYRLLKSCQVNIWQQNNLLCHLYPEPNNYNCNTYAAKILLENFEINIM
jgi:hypothetical protein